MDDNDRAPAGKGVFISYRRGETSGQARALHDRLVQRFGAERVFMDVDSIAPGADFVQKIEEAINSSGVALMLIGRDWVTRGDGIRLFDEVDDFIRLEAETALERGVPIVPILVERARMPSPEELPEPLRPITRRNALELENQRWEYDVSRLVGAVERLIEPAGDSAGGTRKTDRKDGEPERVDERDRDDEEHRLQARPTKRRWLLAGVAVVVAAAAAGIAVALSSPPKPHATLTATGAVGPVPSERLVVALLKNGLGSNIPSQLSASGQSLLSLRLHGLVAAVYVDLSPVAVPFQSSYVDYEIFDNRADAYTFFTNSKPLPVGYKYTGRFTSTGIADTTRCDTGDAPASAGQFERWVSSCAVLSGKVISFINVTSSSNSPRADGVLASALATDAVRQLAKIAAATPKSVPSPPPGSLSPQAMFEQVLTSTFPGTLLPPGVSNPDPHGYLFGSNAPTGLITSSYVNIGLSGPDYRDNVYYYVFDTVQDAQSWFTGLQPGGSTPTNSSIDCSGFSQSVRCGTYSSPTSSQSPPAGISACYVLDGDVIVAAQTWSTTDHQAGNSDLAVTLARAGALDLNMLDG